MLLTRLVVSMFSVCVMVLGTGVVFGQTYPNKPIRIITTPAGGGIDFAARLIASELAAGLGQLAIVDNRVAQIAIETVAKAPPDGYTLLFIGSPLWVLPFLQASLPFDPVRDFSPITLAVSLPYVLVVHPSLPVKSVKELIALAKSRPGELNYASSSLGTLTHSAGELFKAMARVNIVRISYKGVGAAVNDLVGGHVLLMFAAAAAVTPHINSGRLRALAVASEKPSRLLPNLPTVAASGVPGFEAVSITGMLAPAKTPAAVINRLNQEIVRVLNLADVKEKFLNSGGEAVGSSPEQFAAAIKSDMTRMGKVIKDAGMRAE